MGLLEGGPGGKSAEPEKMTDLCEPLRSPGKDPGWKARLALGVIKKREEGGHKITRVAN